MPIHDWTRVDSGMFHAFHGGWITHLSEALNGGLLPEGYYALSEQHAGSRVADVLTLHVPEAEPHGRSTRSPGVLALTEAPPRVARRQVAEPRPAYRQLRRTLVIRHVSGHRIVALIEILSPGNKDRRATVEEFVDKVVEALRLGCHVLVVDLFPPGLHDPCGIHGAIWAEYGETPYDLPLGSPLTMASYMAAALPEAFVDHKKVGEPLPDMPVFLEYDSYIPTPLESTYEQAYSGLPGYWRGVIQGTR